MCIAGIIIIIIIIINPGTQFPGNEKKYGVQYESFLKNQAGMNLTPPSCRPSKMALYRGIKTESR